jgi:hypothetical protein
MSSNAGKPHPESALRRQSGAEGKCCEAAGCRQKSSDIFVPPDRQEGLSAGVLELESRNGRSIDNSLSLFDLFSFDVSRDSDIRMNFEALFQRYETSIETYTRRLLATLSSGTNEVREEVIGLFAANLLNFIRNPYSIKKMMNTFPKVGTYAPVDPLNSYRRMLGGKKPQQTYLCSQLGIGDGDYIEWLRALFILLIPAKQAHPNVFEHIVKSLTGEQENASGCLRS